jgi:hypothetical protein
VFFTYSQNNSGGDFDYNAEQGISCWVVIEADDYQEANYLAERIGLYFGGRGDCPCCGDRWSKVWYGEEATQEPMIYDEPAADYVPWHYWIRGGYNVFVHRKGREPEGMCPGPDMEERA